MSTDAVGNVHDGRGRFGTKPGTDTGLRLFPFDGLSASTRDAIRTDMVSQRGHMALQLENLREEAERVADQAAGVQRAMDDLDNRIADLSSSNPSEPLATPYQGPEHVDDVVEVPGYGTFSRRHDGIFGAWPQHIRIQVDRELGAGEAQHLAQLVGYAWCKTGGERLGEPFQDAPNSIVVFADTTKGRSATHLNRLENGLPEMVYDGTPVYKTDRNGPKGSRLVEALPGIGALNLYYDDVMGG